MYLSTYLPICLSVVIIRFLYLQKTAVQLQYEAEGALRVQQLEDNEADYTAMINPEFQPVFRRPEHAANAPRPATGAHKKRSKPDRRSVLSHITVLI